MKGARTLIHSTSGLLAFAALVLGFLALAPGEAAARQLGVLDDGWRPPPS